MIFESELNSEDKQGFIMSLISGSGPSEASYTTSPSRSEEHYLTLSIANINCESHWETIKAI